jgi:hypothetical protein
MNGQNFIDTWMKRVMGLEQRFIRRGGTEVCGACKDTNFMNTEIKHTCYPYKLQDQQPGEQGLFISTSGGSVKCEYKSWCVFDEDHCCECMPPQEDNEARVG